MDEQEYNNLFSELVNTYEASLEGIISGNDRAVVGPGLKSNDKNSYLLNTTRALGLIHPRDEDKEINRWINTNLLLGYENQWKATFNIDYDIEHSEHNSVLKALENQGDLKK